MKSFYIVKINNLIKNHNKKIFIKKIKIKLKGMIQINLNKFLNKKLIYMKKSVVDYA
jgi:hypothetical protein